MKLNTLTKTLASLSVLSVGLVASVGEQAQAITLPSQTASTQLTITNLEDEPLDFLLPIAQFDPMANMTETENAVLTSVTLTYLGEIETSGTITNQSPDAATFTITVQANANVEGPNGVVGFDFLGNGTASSLNVTFNTDLLAGTDPGPAGSQFFEAESGTSNFTTPPNPIVLTGADLAPFIGNGTVDFDGNTSTALVISGTSTNADADIQTLVDLAVTVQYDFDLVAKPIEAEDAPEPASLLGLLAIGGLGFVTRRRQS